MLIEETLMLDRSLVIPLIIIEIPNSYGNFNKMPSDFENSVKEFMISQKNFNALLEENCSKLMIWLGTLIDFRLMLILLNLDLLLLSMISTSLSK